MKRRLSDMQVDEFRRLVLPHLPLLVRTAKFMTRCETEADDLVQDSMLKALRNFETLKEPQQIRPWLLTIQRRASIDRHRSDPREREVALDAVHEELVDRDSAPRAEIEKWDSPEDLLESFDDLQVVEALRSLPEPIRWTLILVDVEQFDHAHAAQVLQVPQGTIKSRVHRGRAMLRARLLKLAQQRGWIKAADEAPR